MSEAALRDGVKKAWGYRHVILFIIWFIYLINYFDRISVLTFLPFIQKDLTLSAVQIGWLGSIFFFGYSLAQFLAGYLADKIGPKKTMNIAVWVFTIVTGLTGFVQSFWQFIVLRLGLAVGEGQHFAPSLRMIANWFPRDEKGRASGFFSTTWAVAPRSFRSLSPNWRRDFSEVPGGRSFSFWPFPVSSVYGFSGSSLQTPRRPCFRQAK